MSLLELDTMRRRARKDINHEQVVRELRQLGATVLETHQLGSDAPDLIVGFQGITALVEVKPEGKAYTPDAREKARLVRQVDYLSAWRGGPAFVATSTEQVLARLSQAAGGTA